MHICNIYPHTVLVYKDNGFGYMGTVRELTENSMAEARREVQGTHRYILNGDVSKLVLYIITFAVNDMVCSPHMHISVSSLQCIITDARHDSSRAAMHSTVSAISMR